MMTAAWYLHLKYKEWPMWRAILYSWLLAFGEYCLQVPANRIGHTDAKMSAATLRAIAEVAILASFILFQTVVLREPVKLNHLIGFGMVLCGVCIVVAGPWDSTVYSIHDSSAHSEYTEREREREKEKIEGGRESEQACNQESEQALAGGGEQERRRGGERKRNR